MLSNVEYQKEKMHEGIKKVEFKDKSKLNVFNAENSYSDQIYCH